MSGSNDGAGSSWTSTFLQVARAAAAAAAVVDGMYAIISSSSANPEHEAAFGGRRESEERLHGDARSRNELYNNGGSAVVVR
ncbi:hypothetical protein DEO72_LG4g1121 [Vigna unguiculata]|uniref:Uncharacterized protein n=1 Tax=Vigna unguiculata TaxID=3917 RepID=A0A4D6LPT8_VIGUN|nr:hypothetical protein DEO72_LG4g1121 [Vigna unguiculata]